MIAEDISGRRFNEPFPYIFGSKALSDVAANAVIGWLEGEAPWKLVEAEFYQQYEIDLQKVHLPSTVSTLCNKEALALLRKFVESTFLVRLGERIDLTAHKLQDGQRIRIHNDFIPGAETHRLIIQLNHGWSDDNGGLLLLFNSENPSDTHRILRPIHNSFIAFEISPRSLHAVSAVSGSAKRYTLVYSFYEAKPK